MATYKSSYTGPQIDQAVGNALNKDTSTLSNDVNRIPASSVVKSALDNKANQTDLASIHATGSTNTTGAAIPGWTYFYLNGALVEALDDIAANATFTPGTNYETVTAGALNQLRVKRLRTANPVAQSGGSATIPYPQGRSQYNMSIIGAYLLVSSNMYTATSVVEVTLLDGDGIHVANHGGADGYIFVDYI